MKQNEIFELIFYGEVLTENWAEIDLYADFWFDNSTVRVYGFYDGDGIYKIRFLPEYAGLYSWKVGGIFSAEGEAQCYGASEHGIVRAVGTHFETTDGTPFYPFGTTIYALAHQDDTRIAETLGTLKGAPFNKVRHCVFPKHYDYNREEPEIFAFERKNDKWDVRRPCLAFWQKLERIILEMGKLGIQSDLILFHPYDKWGFSSMPEEDTKVYLDYLLRRFAAIPHIWWSLANEFDLVAKRTEQQWYDLEQYVSDHDPYHHLLSCHNACSFYDHSRKNITHCSIQTTQMEWAAQWLEKYNKPIVYDECNYEGNLPQNWGNLSGFEMVHKFWLACTQGTYVTHGEVFLAQDDVLWWSKGGTLKGKSPSRIAFLKKIICSMPGPLTPWIVDPMLELEPELMEIIRNSGYIQMGKRLQDGMDADQKAIQFANGATIRGRCGDEVFVEYLGRHCRGISKLYLPQDKQYRIEIVDVWNMTVTDAGEGMHGTVTIELPSKEGIAVIARLQR